MKSFMKWTPDRAYLDPLFKIKCKKFLALSKHDKEIIDFIYAIVPLNIKSNSLNCSTKIIKSAPKLNRSTCANKILQVYPTNIREPTLT